MALADKAQTDLSWWINNIEHAYKSVTISPPHVTLESDAIKLLRVAGTQIPYQENMWRGLVGENVIGGRSGCLIQKQLIN